MNFKLSTFTVALLLGTASLSSNADETCASPYMAKITGQEDFVYIWTLGSEGVGDEQDKLVTVDVNPKSAKYGKVISSLSVGGRNEAHHADFTDDRKFLWTGGLDTNKIFIFDVATDPAKPKLIKTINDFVAKSGGVVGPHSFHALPGRIIITALSNNKDHGGRTAIVEYSNAGDYIATYWLPTDSNLQGAIKSGGWSASYNATVSLEILCK
jgi:methanethiol oxidase